MAYKSIEKTDNFLTVVFDPSPTAPDMQALYETGWVLHMGPFPGNRGYSALFFREKRVEVDLQQPEVEYTPVYIKRCAGGYAVFKVDTNVAFPETHVEFHEAEAWANAQGYTVI